MSHIEDIREAAEEKRMKQTTLNHIKDTREVVEKMRYLLTNTRNQKVNTGQVDILMGMLDHIRVMEEMRVAIILVKNIIYPRMAMIFTIVMLANAAPAILILTQITITRIKLDIMMVNVLLMRETDIKLLEIYEIDILLSNAVGKVVSENMKLAVLVLVLMNLWVEEPRREAQEDEFEGNEIFLLFISYPLLRLHVIIIL